MIEGLVAGRLYGRAEQRTSKGSGKPFVVARVRAAAAGHEAEAAVFVNVLAFAADVQAALLALGEGEAVTLAGSLTPKAWTDREGQVRPSLDMVASQVLTTYHLQRRRAAMSSKAAPSPAPGSSADGDPDDPL